MADLAERYSLNEIRVTHEQNLVLPHVRSRSDLYAGNLAGPGGTRSWTWPRANIGLVSDIIACPGLDYCNLANARSIPVAQAHHAAVHRTLDRQHDIGDLKSEDLRLYQRLRSSPCRPHRHPGCR